MAGIVPGIMMGISILIAWTWVIRKDDLKSSPRKSRAEVWHALVDGVWALFMPLIIIVGLRMGIFTPTEASVAAVLYALLMGVIDRRLTWKGFYDSMLSAAVSSAVVMIVISTAGLLTWLLAYSMIPQTLTASLASFRPARRERVKVVSLLGGVVEAHHINPIEYTWQLASQLGQ